MQTQDIKTYLLSLQGQIVNALTGYEPDKEFLMDEWAHKDGGGGQSCVLEKGQVFEKAGVNFSHVMGNSLPASATATRPDLKGKAFEAMGVSLVIHPRNPHVPTTHMNVRFFNAQTQERDAIWWFGGGFDLTPYYPVMSDVIHWHQQAKACCDNFGEHYYEKFKNWCDDYFYLKHRGETRGIGGLFFDDFNELGFDQSFAFMQSVGNHFLSAYIPIVEKRWQDEYTENQRAFQAYRRGRYVEFNLVYDRGTLFGLQSGGRTESILMSMPPIANWRYNWSPEKQTPEAQLNDYLKPRNWLD